MFKGNQSRIDLTLRTLIGQGDEVHLAVLNKNPVELRNGCLAGHRVQLLGEYHKGRSPNGQFFRQAVEYAGCGVRVLF